MSGLKTEEETGGEISVKWAGRGDCAMQGGRKNNPWGTDKKQRRDS